MKLSKKNLIYSMILAGILMSLIISYFVLMLPSLYVDYMQSQNLNSVIAQQRAYLKDGDYSGAAVNNPAACFTIEIPLEEDCIYFTNKAIKGKIEPRDEVIAGVFREIREYIKGIEENTEEIPSENLEEELEERIERWAGELSQYETFLGELPVTFTILQEQDLTEFFSDGKMKYHMISDNFYVLEAEAGDQNNHYSNYMACSITEDSIVMSFLPVMSPQMNEILPVVMQSIPMISAVLLLIVLIFSRVYSKGIVTPIVKLAAYTGSIRTEEETVLCGKSPAEEKEDSPDNAYGWRKDVKPPQIENACAEVKLLSDTIRELYIGLQESCRLLSEQNQTLQEENERKEVFLRASSHQLKTPIAAALLLVDGMMSRIGKYQDRDVYLPQVKSRLLSMKNIVEDILYLNHCEEHMEKTEADLNPLIRSLAGAYDVIVREKGLIVRERLNHSFIVSTDAGLLGRVIDNLLSNAVTYTPPGGEIVIETKEKTIRIWNSGIQIPEELLPHVFEPFVSGAHEGKCHGLGLYIAAYYAKRLGAELTIFNVAAGVAAGGETISDAGVCACLKFQ